MKQSNFSHHHLSLYSAQQHCIWLSDCPQDPVLHTELTRPDGPTHDSSPTVDALNQELNQIVVEVEILPQGLPSQHQVHLQSLKISTHSSYVKQMEHKVLTPSLPSVSLCPDHCLITILRNILQTLYSHLIRHIILSDNSHQSSLKLLHVTAHSTLIAAVPVSYESGSMCFSSTYCS